MLQTFTKQKYYIVRITTLSLYTYINYMEKDKAYYNKKYYDANKPYPIRLGKLKAKFQEKAVEEDISLHAYIKKILEKHLIGEKAN